MSLSNNTDSVWRTVADHASITGRGRNTGPAQGWADHVNIFKNVDEVDEFTGLPTVFYAPGKPQPMVFWPEKGTNPGLPASGFERTAGNSDDDFVALWHNIAGTFLETDLEKKKVEAVLFNDMDLNRSQVHVPIRIVGTEDDPHPVCVAKDTKTVAPPVTTVGRGGKAFNGVHDQNREEHVGRLVGPPMPSKTPVLWTSGSERAGQHPLGYPAFTNSLFADWRGPSAESQVLSTRVADLDENNAPDISKIASLATLIHVVGTIENSCSAAINGAPAPGNGLAGRGQMTDGGYFPQKAFKPKPDAVCYMSRSGGGPISAGAGAGDRHFVGDVDGVPHVGGHLDLAAPWFASAEQDAPPKADGKIYRPTFNYAGAWAEVFMRYNPEGQHRGVTDDFAPLVHQGLFQWQVKIPIFVPPPKKKKPPPYPPVGKPKGEDGPPFDPLNPGRPLGPDDVFPGGRNRPPDDGVFDPSLPPEPGESGDGSPLFSLGGAPIEVFPEPGVVQGGRGGGVLPPNPPPCPPPVGGGKPDPLEPRAKPESPFPFPWDPFNPEDGAKRGDGIQGGADGLGLSDEEEFDFRVTSMENFESYARFWNYVAHPGTIYTPSLVCVDTGDHRFNMEPNPHDLEEITMAPPSALLIPFGTQDGAVWSKSASGLPFDMNQFAAGYTQGGLCVYPPTKNIDPKVTARNSVETIFALYNDGTTPEVFLGFGCPNQTGEAAGKIPNAFLMGLESSTLKTWSTGASGARELELMTLDSQGAFEVFSRIHKQTSDTTGFTAQVGRTHRVDTSGGAGSVNLPALSSVNYGERITFKDYTGDCGANHLTLTPNGSDEFVHSSRDPSLSAPYEAITIEASSDGWLILSRSSPNGGRTYKTITAASHDMTDSPDTTLYFIDTTSNAVTLQLGSAADYAGVAITCIDVAANFATNNFSIDPGLATVNGDVSPVFNVDETSVTITSNGTNWFIE